MKNFLLLVTLAFFTFSSVSYANEDGTNSELTKDEQITQLEETIEELREVLKAAEEQNRRLVELLEITAGIDFYEDERKKELGFYEDFSDIDYDLYLDDTYKSIVPLIENNIIKIKQDSNPEFEYGLNRESRILSIIIYEDVSMLEIMLIAKVHSFSLSEIAKNYSVQVFLGYQLDEPVLFLHNADVIYDVTNEETNIEDIEQYH